MAKLETEVHVRISARMYEALKRASKQTGCTIAWVMRHSTQRYLLQKGFFTDEISSNNL